MRIASTKTLECSKSTRMLYAKKAIDREMIIPLIVEWPEITPELALHWALKEQAYLAGVEGNTLQVLDVVKKVPCKRVKTGGSVKKPKPSLTLVKKFDWGHQ